MSLNNLISGDIREGLIIANELNSCAKIALEILGGD